MRCRCGREWCWMCRRDWGPHGTQYYDCFQYVGSDAEALDQKSNSVKKDNDRYQSYRQRFLDHLATEKDAINKRNALLLRTDDYNKFVVSSKTILDGFNELIRSRHIIRHFYVYLYFHESDQNSKLITIQRNLAENFIEHLADSLFHVSSEQHAFKIPNLIRVTKKYVDSLVDELDSLKSC
eukprot:TRINITY_DN2939_c0_g2_i1.p1 TRINITY_DN2939_c0_g2~~TRINITY_DN2939_c0_g2_i1.p1  ORF type:complete len:181 (+),score=45.73 TRINITY_DN2939_c0_g2_i1:283-825(+)